MMSRKNGVCQVIKACVTVGTLIALTGQLRVIKATLDDVFELTRWAVDAVWPAQIAYRLITLNIIDQILDIDLHRWTPVRGWDMGWHQCTPYSNSTTLESNMSVRLCRWVQCVCRERRTPQCGLPLCTHLARKRGGARSSTASVYTLQTARN